ncbi:MAG: hypothetical protein IKP49_02070 [Treponema sp.]|nr:hypothetical protein [Treponema sp.]
MRKNLSVLFCIFFCFTGIFAEEIDRFSLKIDSTQYCYTQRIIKNEKTMLVRLIDEEQYQLFAAFQEQKGKTIGDLRCELDSMIYEISGKSNQNSNDSDIFGGLYVVDKNNFEQILRKKGVLEIKNSKELSKRVCNLLGLNHRDTTYYIVTFPTKELNLKKDIIRPAVDTDPTVRITNIAKAYKSFRNENFPTLKKKYMGNDYWTGLGYTYDIGDKTDYIGVTEFALEKDVIVKIDKIITLEDFIKSIKP